MDSSVKIFALEFRVPKDQKIAKAPTFTPPNRSR
jgi:hypothetical protein